MSVYALVCAGPRVRACVRARAYMCCCMCRAQHRPRWQVQRAERARCLTTVHCWLIHARAFAAGARARARARARWAALTVWLLRRWLLLNIAHLDAQPAPQPSFPSALITRRNSLAALGPDEPPCGIRHDFIYVGFGFDINLSSADGGVTYLLFVVKRFLFCIK